MDISCIFFGLLFTVGGLLFALGKLHVHFKAWKHMPEEEKSKLNITALVRNVGEVIMLCGILFLLRGLIPDFSGKWFIGSMIAWLIVAGFDVWHISRSSRYRNKDTARR